MIRNERGTWNLEEKHRSARSHKMLECSESMSMPRKNAFIRPPNDSCRDSRVKVLTGKNKHIFSMRYRDQSSYFK